MIALEDLETAKETVWRDSMTVLGKLKELTLVSPNTASAAVEVLMKIRDETAEEINQVQHEQLILNLAEKLVEQGIVRPETVWEWNPRQTGTSDEPDLRGAVDGDVVISAEATTSLKPQGGVDTRMRKTLSNLSQMPGHRIYGVRTQAMVKRAKRKIEKGEYNIAVYKVDV